MKYLIMAFMIVLMSSCYKPSGSRFFAAAKQNTILISELKNSVLTINNPFGIAINIEFKCNWNGKKFTYLKNLVLKERSKYTIIVPKNSMCQIWPWLR